MFLNNFSSSSSFAYLEDEGDDVVAYVPLAGQLLPGEEEVNIENWTDITLVSGDDKYFIVLHCTTSTTLCYIVLQVLHCTPLYYKYYIVVEVLCQIGQAAVPSTAFYNRLCVLPF